MGCTKEMTTLKRKKKSVVIFTTRMYFYENTGTIRDWYSSRNYQRNSRIYHLRIKCAIKDGRKYYKF